MEKQVHKKALEANPIGSLIQGGCLDSADCFFMSRYDASSIRSDSCLLNFLSDVTFVCHC